MHRYRSNHLCVHPIPGRTKVRQFRPYRAPARIFHPPVPPFSRCAFFSRCESPSFLPPVFSCRATVSRPVSDGQGWRKIGDSIVSRPMSDGQGRRWRILGQSHCFRLASDGQGRWRISGRSHCFLTCVRWLRGRRRKFQVDPTVPDLRVRWSDGGENFIPISLLPNLQSRERDLVWKGLEAFVRANTPETGHSLHANQHFTQTTSPCPHFVNRRSISTGVSISYNQRSISYNRRSISYNRSEHQL